MKPILTSWRYALCIALLGTVALPTPASSDELETNQNLCFHELEDLDSRVAACTWLLDSGRLDDWQTVSVLVFKGEAHMKQEDYQAAISSFQRVDELMPPAGVFDFLQLSGAYREAGMYDKALARLDRAVEVDDQIGAGGMSGIGYQFDLGLTLHAMGDYDGAVEAYTTALSYKDVFGMERIYYLVRYNRALSYEAMGKPDLAREELAMVLSQIEAYGGDEAWQSEGEQDSDFHDTFARFDLR